MIHFRTSVRIGKPPADVFEYVADPTTYPRWNSAVDEVKPLGDGAARRYEMRRQLPSGKATNLLEVTEVAAPERVVIRASNGPTPFTYRYQLSGEGEGTVVTLDADVELTGVFRLAGPLGERAVKRGVDDNLATLKRIVEAA